MLLLTFILAFILMKDLGFKPARGKNPIKEIKTIVAGSVKQGLRNPPVRWIMLASPFTGGVTIYAFYAMQPYLLELYGDEKAYGVAGLAAAIVAGAQIGGGLLVAYTGLIFRTRTLMLLVCEVISTLVLLTVGVMPNSGWFRTFDLVGLMFAAVMPVRKAYLMRLSRLSSAPLCCLRFFVWFNRCVVIHQYSAKLRMYGVNPVSTLQCRLQAWPSPSPGWPSRNAPSDVITPSSERK